VINQIFFVIYMYLTGSKRLNRIRSHATDLGLCDISLRNVDLLDNFDVKTHYLTHTNSRTLT